MKLAILVTLAAGAAATSQQVCLDLLGEAKRQCTDGAGTDRCGQACEDATTELFLHLNECRDAETGRVTSFEAEAQAVATGTAAVCAELAIDCVDFAVRARACASAVESTSVDCGATAAPCGEALVDDASVGVLGACYDALTTVDAWDSVVTYARTCATVDADARAARLNALETAGCRAVAHGAWEACEQPHEDMCAASCADRVAVATAPELMDECHTVQVSDDGETYHHHIEHLRQAWLCACDRHDLSYKQKREWCDVTDAWDVVGSVLACLAFLACNAVVLATLCLCCKRCCCRGDAAPAASAVTVVRADVQLLTLKQREAEAKAAAAAATEEEAGVPPMYASLPADEGEAAAATN